MFSYRVILLLSLLLLTQHSFRRQSQVFSTNTKNKKKQWDDHLESETPELTVITSAVNRERNDMDATSGRYFPEPDLRVNGREGQRSITNKQREQETRELLTNKEKRFLFMERD